MTPYQSSISEFKATACVKGFQLHPVHLGSFGANHKKAAIALNYSVLELKDVLDWTYCHDIIQFDNET